MKKWARDAMRWWYANEKAKEEWPLPTPAKCGVSTVTMEQLLNQVASYTLENEGLQLYDSDIQWVHHMDAFKYTLYFRGSLTPFGGPERISNQHAATSRGEGQLLFVERSE